MTKQLPKAEESKRLMVAFNDKVRVRIQSLRELTGHDSVAHMFTDAVMLLEWAQRCKNEGVQILIRDREKKISVTEFTFLRRSLQNTKGENDA